MPHLNIPGKLALGLGCRSFIASEIPKVIQRHVVHWVQRVNQSTVSQWHRQNLERHAIEFEREKVGTESESVFRVLG